MFEILKEGRAGKEETVETGEMITENEPGLVD